MSWAVEIITKTLVSKEQFELAIKKVTGVVAVREELVVKNFKSNKIVTHAEEGMLLAFQRQKPYKNSDGEVVTIMITYKNVDTGMLYAISMRDLLNKLEDSTGSILAQSVVFIGGNWDIPAILFLDVVEAYSATTEKSKLEYPLVSYKGYSSSIFDEKDALKLEKKIKSVKTAKNLKDGSKPFLKTIRVITNVEDLPTA